MSIDSTAARAHDPDEPPDVAGTTATCKTCGTSIGPIVGYSGASVRLGCPCGTVLEAWPDAD